MNIVGGVEEVETTVDVAAASTVVEVPSEPPTKKQFCFKDYRLEVKRGELLICRLLDFNHIE